MIDKRDPHFALGVEHAAHGWVPYQWSDPEHQRRYDLGYRHAAFSEAQAANARVRTAVYDQLRRLQKLGVPVRFDDD